MLNTVTVRLEDNQYSGQEQKLKQNRYKTTKWKKEQKKVEFFLMV